MNPLDPALQAELSAYIDRRQVPGDFLIAVLANDLRAALGAASEVEQASLPALVSWLRERAPRGSWGSVGLVDSWLRGADERGVSNG